MFRKRREQKRIDNDFEQLTSQLSDIDRDLLTGNGPRDYSLVEPDPHFQPPQLRKSRLHWLVIMATGAVIFMCILPLVVYWSGLTAAWWFWTAEAAATLVFVTCLFAALKTERNPDDPGAVT